MSMSLENQSEGNQLYKEIFYEDMENRKNSKQKASLKKYRFCLEQPYFELINCRHEFEAGNAV